MSQQEPIREDTTRAALNTRAEAGPQPDPMLKEGRAGATRKWGITFGIVAVVLFVMYGLTARHEEQAANPPTITRSNNPQPGAPSGGRITADAPASPNVVAPK